MSVNRSAHKNLAVIETFKQLPRIVTNPDKYVLARILQQISTEVIDSGDLYRAGDIVISGRPPIHYPDGFDATIVAVGARWEVYQKREVGGGFVGFFDDPTTRPEDTEAISVGLIYLNDNILIPCRGVHLRFFAKVLRWMMNAKGEFNIHVKAESFYGGPVNGSGQTIYFFNMVPR